MKSVLITVLLASIYASSTQNDENHATLPLFSVQIPESIPASCLMDQQRETALSELKTMVTGKLNLAMRTPCGGDLWTRVAYLNMSDPTQSCPQNWTDHYSTDELRVCGRTSGSCSSVFYPTDGRFYNAVCGQIIGYQFGHPDGIMVRTPNYTIDEVYVDGISVTHGSPRSHIWTFAGSRSNVSTNCPCKGGENAPFYVGDNYYCESGYNGDRNGNPPTVLYPSDPLWDGVGCESEGTCCSTAPWFTVNLVNPTSDDIEVRICASATVKIEDTPIHLLELYIL
jgi:dynein heavy chain